MFGLLAAPTVMAVAVLAIYHGWLQHGIITSGDWLPTPASRMLNFWPIPSLWNASWNTGALDIFSNTAFLQLNLFGVLAKMGIDYNWAERLVWILPAVLIASVGGYVLSFSLFRSRVAAVLSGLFLVSNSYIVLINGGGQFTVGVAYAFMPLIVWSYRAAVHSNKLARYLLTALFLALQGAYDLRLTYITVAMLALYAPFLMADLHTRAGLRNLLLRFGKQALLCLIVAVLIYSPWLLPTLLVKAPALPAGYSVAGQVQGLSYMHLVNGFSLMHVFWPTNPLGDIHPVDPIFFLIPLFVFALLLRASRSRDLQYFYSLILVAIFFVKGDNPPAGQIYIWFFTHVPGFSWFRDPSKFYQPLMVGVAVLLGYAAVTTVRWLQRHGPRAASRLLASSWLAIWLLAAIYPAMPGIIPAHWGTLSPTPMPADYARLNAMIDGQSQFFRTLWFPRFERFGTFSDRHPALEAWNIGVFSVPPKQLPKTGNVLSWPRLPGAINALRALVVKYVVVPSDPLDELYSTSKGPINYGLTFQSALLEVRQDFRAFHETVIGGIHVFENPAFTPQISVPAQFAVRHVQPPVAQLEAIPRFLDTSTSGGPAATAASVTPVVSMTAAIDYRTTTGVLPRIQPQSQGSDVVSVAVRGATRPFVALFLQGYDPNWRAYVLPAGARPTWWTLWRAQPIAARYHMIGDGYANAWWINARGSFTLALVYWPQLLMIVGAILSWATVLGCTGYVLVTWLRDRRRRAERRHVVQHLAPPSPSVEEGEPLNALRA